MLFQIVNPAGFVKEIRQNFKKVYYKDHCNHINDINDIDIERSPPII